MIRMSSAGGSLEKIALRLIAASGFEMHSLFAVFDAFCHHDQSAMAWLAG
jgi:hypothetical protein